MNLASFKSYLLKKDTYLQSTLDQISEEIQSGNFRDSASLWNNPDLVNVPPPDDIRVANVIFPNQVHLMTTSVFYDRIYVHVNDFTFDYKSIDNEILFHQEYQMNPNDFIELTRCGKVVPIFSLQMNSYTDFMLENVLFPIITNDLNYITFAGQSLICQVWQVEHNAIPNPKQDSTWGFLMDLCGALGIGANLVRPEFAVDWWDKRQLIFDALTIDEIQTQFHNPQISLNDFFIATGIDYDSRVPCKEYLEAFKRIDRNKLYKLYKKIDKSSFFDEMQKVNNLSHQVSKGIDQEHFHKQVISAGVVFFWCILKNWLKSKFLGPIVDGMDAQIKKTLKDEKGYFLGAALNLGISFVNVKRLFLIV